MNQDESRADPPSRVKSEDIETAPAMGAITDRQLLVDMAQKMSALVTSVKDGFDASTNRDLELVHRVTGLEQWRNSVDDRLNSNSLRASEPSKHDLEAKAALAAEISKREALAKKVDVLDTKQDAQTVLINEIKGAVVTWFSSPAGKVARYVAWGAVLGWLMKNNIHIPGVN